MSERAFHPAANLFPLMDDDDLQALAEDILAHGLQQPIELLDDKIIDGRNRYKACLIVSVTPRFVKVYPQDPVAHVLSRNLHRRHLTTSQRAMIAARAKEYYEEEAKKRQTSNLKRGDESPVVVKLPQREKQGENAEKGKSRDLAGQALRVSGSTVDAASKVLEQAPPEVIKAVDEGKLSVSAAAKTITKQKSKPTEQARAVDGDNRPIPGYLVPLFQTNEKFEKFAQTISTLKGQVHQAIEENPVAWARFNENDFRAKLDRLHDSLVLSAPYLVCCYCGGEQSKNCQGCKGAGFLSKAQARCVPQEMRR